MRKEYEESKNNPLDAPVPGQSLTDKPGNYPWEHPPLYETPEEASEYVWQTLHQEQFIEQILGMLEPLSPLQSHQQKPLPAPPPLQVQWLDQLSLLQTLLL